MTASKSLAKTPDSFVIVKVVIAYGLWHLSCLGERSITVEKVLKIPMKI